MDKSLDRALVWLRRDLRVDDHAALHHALRAARHVWCAFVFDRALLDPLPRRDRRVEFIRGSLVAVDERLRALGEAHGHAGCGLIACHGQAVEQIVALADRLGVQAVYASHDDDPYARARDAHARGALADIGVMLHTLKDHVVFERSEVLSQSGSAYTVFTPYKTAWLRRLDDAAIAPWMVAPHAAALAPLPGSDGGMPTLADLDFLPTNLHALRLPSGPGGAEQLLEDFLSRIDRYAQARDFPAVKGPSYLGPHLRFGTLSVRRLAREAFARMRAGSRGAEVWLSELVWRDFFQQILHHHPHVVGHAFKPEFEHLHWERGRHADQAFAAWCEGRTGYPLVDAAMRQLEDTGYMHNRLRMVSASFLVKDLGIDWRRGEAYFAEKLNDFELASNNGGWQWAASTGCDAQPYFRIFNPVAQSEKFDPQGRFIRHYLPALAKLPDAMVHAPWAARPVDLAAAGVELGRSYPMPIVQHETARARTLERYAAARRAKPRR